VEELGLINKSHFSLTHVVGAPRLPGQNLLHSRVQQTGTVYTSLV